MIDLFSSIGAAGPATGKLIVKSVHVYVSSSSAGRFNLDNG